MDEPSKKNEKLSRRDFFRGPFAKKSIEKVVDAVGRKVDAINRVVEEASAAPQSSAPTDQKKPPPRGGMVRVVRPPGAVEEKLFLERCTSCGECVQACPHDVIVNAPSRFRAAAGTPMLNFSQNACVMCEDFPCIASCQDDALLWDWPKKIADAVVQNHDCIADHSFCSVCMERCPVENAIVMEGLKPKIMQDLCTGCGVCHLVCPAPNNAIMMLPILNRTQKKDV